MANETEFNYEPLSSSTRQIRLLRILPTTTNIEIECELQTSDLPEEGLSTPFAAISYEWGAATALKPITVNGKRFWIRPNCHYALLQAHRYLCRKRGPSLIWVDSVCINQDDIDERSEQVALMGKLYSAASVSLACVGPAELDSEWMFRILKSANSNCTSICWEEKLFAAFNNARSTKVALNEAYKKYLHKRFHGAALCFSARTYWTRRWIVQEMLLPRTVVVLCGNFLAGFDVGFHDQIAGFNGIISSLVSLRRKGWAIDLDTGSRYDKFEKRCLAELLSLLRQQKCSERHDWIYALLGVSKFETNKNDTPLVPDYRRSDLNTALHTIDVLLHCASYNGSAIDRDYGFVREIVNGLCLSLGQTDVQAMFQRRRLEKIAAPRDGARDQIFARIRDAESAQIQGSIHKLSAGVNDMLEVRGFQLPGYYPSPDARFESYEELPDGYQSFASPAGPLIGYVSSSILPGDFLVHLHDFPWLVIRWDAELEIFRFVGRAFIPHAWIRHCPHCLEGQYEEIERDSSLADARTFVSFVFDAEDLVAMHLYEKLHTDAVDTPLLSQPDLEQYPITRTSLSSYAIGGWGS